jgi:hypothetical protein
MSLSEPPASRFAAMAGFVTGNLQGRIIAWTAGIGVILGFVTAVEALYHQGRSVACATGIWCPAPGPSEIWSDEVGGAGGKSFSPLACRDGEVLIGVSGKTGDGPWVYSIGPLCAAAQFSWRQRLSSLSPVVHRGDQIGSKNGEPFDLVCPSNMVVVGFDLDTSIVGTSFAGRPTGDHDYLVIPLNLRCSSVLVADTALRSTVTQTNQRQGNASQTPFQCPDGSVAYAVKGRVGQYIDAISLGCRRI